ncbi:MAG: immunity 7 family protein [Sandaracinaceae bacterium]|nr:immunity 7 family protein [Sandaracinaceae bacterium]
MFEYHGWIVVRYHTHDIDGARQTDTWDAVLAHVESLGITGLLQMGRHNGLDVVGFHGLKNHRVEWPIALMRFVGETAPGSYGLLYVRDDEDPRGPGHDDTFLVWRLVRGRVDERADALLSPVIPTIEDPYDPSRPDG